MKALDWRAVAQPSDFETSISRPPKPPKNVFFTENLSTGIVTVNIVDWNEPDGRGPNAAYRCYFVSSAIFDKSKVSRIDVLKSGYKLGVIVGDVRPASRGRTSSISVSKTPSDPGWFFVTGINPKGEESAPTPPLAYHIT